jgi:ADP-heptose:LPS heptosyltransferase
MLTSFYKAWLRFQIRPVTQGSPPKNVHSVWIVLIQLLGDSILISPIPQLVKEKWPNAKITVIADARNRDIWRFNPYVDRVIETHGLSRPMKHGLIHDYGKLTRIAKMGREEGIDLMLCMDHTSYGIYLGMLTHPKWGVGFQNKKIGQDHWSVSIQKPDRNMTELYQQMVSAAGIKTAKWKQQLYWPKEATLKAENLLKHDQYSGRKLIGLSPWTSMSVKDWHPDQVIRFCELAFQKGFLVVLLGSGANRNEAENVVSHAKDKPLNLVGKTTLIELMAVVDKLDAVISCDSGTAHLSAALNKELVVLFGHIDPGIWKPFSTKMTILKKETCKACQRFKCKKPKCMNFSAEEVLRALTERLRHTMGKNREMFI